MEGLIV
jgi:hypothetical protein